MKRQEHRQTDELRASCRTPAATANTLGLLLGEALRRPLLSESREGESVVGARLPPGQVTHRASHEHPPPASCSPRRCPASCGLPGLKGTGDGSGPFVPLFPLTQIQSLDSFVPPWVSSRGHWYGHRSYCCWVTSSHTLGTGSRTWRLVRSPHPAWAPRSHMEPD